jgi:hypothetical protein
VTLSIDRSSGSAAALMNTTTPPVPDGSAPSTGTGTTTPGPAPGTTGATVDDDPTDKPLQGFWQHMGRGAEHGMNVGTDAWQTITESPMPLLIGGTVSAGLAYRTASINAAAVNKAVGVRGTLNEFVLNGIRVTPALIAGVVGPAAADGVSYLAPNLIPKYRRSMSDGEKSEVQIKRAIAGGLVVGALAGITWLIRPQLLKPTAGFISDQALNGYNVARPIGGAGLAKTILAAGEAVPEGMEVVKRYGPMARDAVFSNRLLLGLVGGGATAYLANRFATAKPEERMQWGLGAAAVGAATVGGVASMRMLTRTATSARGILPDAALFWKPNPKFMKEVFMKVIAPTAGIGGTAAFHYFDVVNDFNKIVDTHKRK